MKNSEPPCLPNLQWYISMPKSGMKGEAFHHSEDPSGPIVKEPKVSMSTSSSS
jgi:hypothetical protein